MESNVIDASKDASEDQVSIFRSSDKIEQILLEEESPATTAESVIINEIREAKTLRAEFMQPNFGSTIIPPAATSRSIRIPGLNLATVMSQDDTAIILFGRDVQDQSSEAGIQYSTLMMNQAAVRISQYGNNSGHPEVIGFKSRGLTMGDKSCVFAGDVLWKASAIGISSDNFHAPLAGTIAFEIPAGGIFSSSLSPNFVISLAQNTSSSIRKTWSFDGMTGDLNMISSGSRIRLKEGLNSMQGLATLDSGNVVVFNTLITANSRVMLSIQEGAAPNGVVYISSRSVGNSFKISSTRSNDTCKVAWQIWEPTT